MKIKLAFLSLFGLCCCSPLAFAQSDSAVPGDSEPLSVPAIAEEQPVMAEEEQPVIAEEQPVIGEESAAPADSARAQFKQPIDAELTLGRAGTDENTHGAVWTAPPSENRGPLILEQELPAAIQFLARMASLNIQFDPSLVFTNTMPGPDGKVAAAPVVSLRWENVTAEDALQEVLDNYGLMLMVSPKTGVGRVTRKPTQAPLVMALVQLKYSSPSNMMNVVKSTFAEPQRSKITADLRTSQLVIVTTEREMYAVTNLITQLDTPTRQVLIEARLIETATNPRSIKGIDWSGTLEGQNFSFGNGFTSGSTVTRTPGNGTTTTLPSGRTMNGAQGTSATTELLTTLGAGGISADTARGFHPSTAFLNADGVRAVLSFLNTESDTEVVATPRAVTVDNETATLSVTRAFPIFEITPGSANVAAGAQIKYTNLGTILKVTPRITANSNISLKVIPEVSNIDSKDRQIINGTVNEANVYAIRRMEADVVIPSGNTLVMGGLISDSSSKSYNKVPLLGDLPGIGMAFRRDTKARSKANLIIFITPTVVNDQDFQPTPTTFLQTPIPERADVEESAWNSGKPYRWTGRGKK